MINQSKNTIRNKFNSTSKSNNKNIFLKASAFLIFSILIIGNLPNVNVGAAGTIAGRVFQDYNGNGTFDTVGTVALPAIDAGVQNVTVTAYDSNGAAQGSAVTAATGIYSITATGTGPYRIEFTNLPANYQPSARSTDSVTGGTTTNAGSTVQFVANGNTADVNLAINVPEDYCQNNPSLCTSIARPGNQTQTLSTTVSFPYEAPTANTTLANESQTGAVYGVAYQRTTKTVFQSAYMKRHAGFGSLGTGGIYKVDLSSGSPVFGTYVNVQSIGLNTGTDPRVTAGYTLPATGATKDWDYAAYTEVGKRSIGDMDYDAGRNTLWFINLNDRRLHGIKNVNPAVTPVNADLVRDSSNALGYSVNTPTPITCTNGVLRPFGLKIYRGLVYVGAVCTGESAGATAANLTAYVFSINPDAATPAFTQVITYPLNYSRTKMAYGNSSPWQPWINSDSNRAFTVGGLSQPMVGDIEFDKDGSLILGLRDRFGDQYAVGQYLPDSTRPTAVTTGEIYGFGDILRFCNSGGTLLNPATAGCANNPRPVSENVENLGSSQGPGGGEFYGGDWGPTDADQFAENMHGALAFLPGSNRVVGTALDPNQFYDNGMIYLSNTDGSKLASYQVYAGSNLSSTNDFNKGNGLGDLELLCDSAPIEIGNRVWRDTNGNGVQDPGEAGISGVTVRLYNAANTLIATAVTDTNGEYYFTSGTAADGNITDNIGIVNGQITPNTNYQVRFDLAANYTGAGPLAGLLMTTRNQTSQLGFDDGSDSDAFLVSNPISSPAGTYPVIPVTTGTAGSNNHDLDVGFTSSTTYTIGNRVWFDTNNDGQINAGEVGINGVSVSLFLDANGDGVPDTPGTPVATQNTASGGYYRFDNLSATNYVVRINPANFANGAVLSGYENTSGSSNADVDSTSVAGENGENGINPVGAANSVQTNGILSGSITLGAPGEPVSESDVLGATQGSIDAAANLTIDFGFYRMSLSGTLWNDNGAGTPANINNGMLNAGEPGIYNLRVQLYDSSNVEILVGPDGILGTSDDAAGGMFTTTTGDYNFQGLLPGTYRVVVTPGTATSSTPTSTTPDDNINNNDDGTPQVAGVFSGKVTSGLVTLTPGNAGALGNNTVTNATGATSNPTVDFGFILAPTIVKMEKFDAYTDGGSVELKWSTGDESGNLGFNVYREVNGKRHLLNSAPIAGNALRFGTELAASGSEYSWTDNTAVGGAVYYIEDLDMNGSTDLHGAITPQFRASLGKKPNAKTLSDLTSAETADGLKQTVGGGKLVSAPARDSAGLLARQQQIAALGGAKIFVNHDGWYRVSVQQLQAAGFDTNSNPQRWQLFADGGEIPFKLNSDRSIEFFGHGLDTQLTDKQAYYLISGQANGLRIGAVEGGGAGEQADAESFSVTVERKDRALYVSALRNGEDENWFGAAVIPNQQTVQTLNAVNVKTDASAHLSVKLQGVVLVSHLVNVKINDTDLGVVTFGNYENKQFEFDVPANALREGVNSVYLQAVGASNDASLVDTIRLSYRRGYTTNNNRLRFTVPAAQSVRVNGFNDANISVFELRGGIVRQQIFGSPENVENNYGFSLSAANYDREMIAVADSTVETASVERNAPSTWNRTDNQANFVIITSGELRESADNLAAMREAQGLKTKVVLVDDLFDEFTYGRRDPEAIRSFLRTATTRWRTQPQYALLFGDSSYDSRNNLGLTVTRDIVPTKLVDTAYMETSSDAWLADFDYDGAEDIALGRLPVGDAAEAAAAVEKLARFDAQGVRQENRDVFIADSGFDSYNAALQTLLPRSVSSVRIDRGALSDAETHRRITEQLDDNPLLVTYTGHGSQTVWATTGVFRNEDAAELVNTQLSFYLVMNCLNGYTHQPTGDSLGESLIRASNGAIAVWTSSGITQSDKQSVISQAFTTHAFAATVGEKPRLGDVVKAAKRASDDTDVRRTWQLLGDPTLFIK